MMRTWRTVGVCVLLLTGLLSPAPVVGQATQLERAEELTRLGRPEEARVSLMEWWERASDDASRGDLQRALWLRARLTVDPVQAELDFRRLVVLYPRGPYTPGALLRLAQAQHEMGDADAARGYVETLTRDFPSSPERREAESWLRAAGPAPPRAEPSPPASVPVTGRPTEPSNVESRPLVQAEGAYYVQLGAFAELERATALADEVGGQGIEVRVVRVDGSRFFHVRFGRFVQREDAVAELERLAGLGVTAALVRDERPERPLGGA